jgi:hypothetical protein
LPPHLDVAELTAALIHDNKRGCITSAPGEVPMVLLRHLGEPGHEGDLPLVNVSQWEIRDALVAMMAWRDN